MMRDPDAWPTVPGLTLEEREALRSESTSGFWRQPKQLRVTVATLCLAAIVQYVFQLDLSHGLRNFRDASEPITDHIQGLEPGKSSYMIQ